MIQYGVFNSFWDNTGPHHLPLLNLVEEESDPAAWNLNISLSRLYNILETNTKTDVTEGIKLLLQDSNWRAHLIACLAILALTPPQRVVFIDLFWDRVIKGSWACPQILVTLLLIDNDFIAVANLILTSNDKGIYREKIKAALEFLLSGNVNDSEASDSGGYIAKGWRSNLINLVESKRVRANDILLG